MIEIDTARWWEDKEYYSTWTQRLMADEREVQERGLELEIECATGFVGDVVNALTAKDDAYKPSHALPAAWI